MDTRAFISLGKASRQNIVSNGMRPQRINLPYRPIGVIVTKLRFCVMEKSLMLIIRAAAVSDAPLLLRLSREFAEYERQPDAVVIKEETLIRDGFGSQPKFRSLIAIARWATRLPQASGLAQHSPAHDLSRPSQRRGPPCNILRSCLERRFGLSRRESDVALR